MRFGEYALLDLKLFKRPSPSIWRAGLSFPYSDKFKVTPIIKFRIGSIIDRTIHWDAAIQQRQKEMLDSLPENQREFMAFTIRTTNVSLHYYRDINADPTEEDFEEWISILPKQLSDKYRKDGYAKSKGILPLRRHTAERNDIGLSEYMRQSLTSEDYKKWVEQGKEIDSPQT